MAKQRGLKRLYRLRVLEEELSRLPLEAALAEQTRTTDALNSVETSRAEGRRSYVAGVVRDDKLERTEGQKAMELADRMRQQLLVRLDQVRAEVARQQQEFLVRRTDRKQVEVLLDTVRREAARQDAHRAQQMLDDWYGRSAQERRGDRKRATAEASETGKP